jgi:hypothetical protein
LNKAAQVKACLVEWLESSFWPMIKIEPLLMFTLITEKQVRGQFLHGKNLFISFFDKKIGARSFPRFHQKNQQTYDAQQVSFLSTNLLSVSAQRIRSPVLHTSTAITIEC